MPDIQVGVPAWVGPELLSAFPREAALVPVAAEPTQAVEIDFWVAPVYPREARAVAPHLRGVRIVQSLLAGVDWLRPLVPAGATLCDGQGMHNIPTAEWVVAAILNTLKFFPLYGTLQSRGDWRARTEADAHYHALHRSSHTGFLPTLQEELYGKHVLIVGYGSIGKSIEERLAPFGAEITRVARTARPGVESVDRLRELLPNADIVILIVPATPETVGLIGARELDLLPQGALLVNAARGPVVDAPALLAALNAGRIRAALDVTDPEPLPPGHPLWQAPNVLITPHVAASSPKMLTRAIEFATAQVARYINDEPLLNIVTGNY